MSNYPGPKQLTRSRDDRVVAGVCGGLARYLNADPSLVRIGVVVLSLFTGVGLIAYIVAAIVVPEDGATSSLWQQNNPFGQRRMGDPTAADGPIYRDASTGAPNGGVHNGDDLR